MKKLLGIVVLGLLLNVKSFAQESCTDFIEFKWWYAGDDGITKVSKKDNPGWARFEFRSTSDKDITITRLYLKTADGKEIVNTSRNVFIRSYGKAHTMMFSLATLNLDNVKTASYSCMFGKQSEETFKKNVEKDVGVKLNWGDDKKMSWSATSDSSLTWLPALIAGIIIAVVVPLLLNSKQNPFENKRNVRNVTAKRNNDRNKNSNIIEIVWAGEETMSKTFWIYCILTVAIVSFLSGLALSFLGNIIWLIPVSVIIWSNTGLWRSSNFYQNEKLKNKQSYGWATAAKVYVVLNYITTLSQIGLSLNV